MCDMEEYADAIVGTVGEGLNVEQRKVRSSSDCVNLSYLYPPQRLTVGVELAAKVTKRPSKGVLLTPSTA